MTFELQYTDNASDARTGIITTAHGQIKTPIFMPVGTVGSVKEFTSMSYTNRLKLRLFWATHTTYIYAQA